MDHSTGWKLVDPQACANAAAPQPPKTGIASRRRHATALPAGRHFSAGDPTGHPGSVRVVAGAQRRRGDRQPDTAGGSPLPG